MTSHKFSDAVKTGTEKGGYEKGRIAILAYHTKTEPGTGEIAEAIQKETPTSKYIFKGKRVPSTKITHTHSDKLSSLLENSETAISIHGHEKKGAYDRGNESIDYGKTVYVSGQNSQLSRKVAKEIRDNLGENYNIETNPKYIPKHLQGKSDYNIVNKFKQGGVQVELPSELRKNAEHRNLVSSSITKVVEKESEISYSKPKEYKLEHKKAE